MDEQLKPCPFCGAPAEYNEYYDCPRCGNDECLVDAHATVGTTEQKIKRWNTRHGDVSDRENNVLRMLLRSFVRNFAVYKRGSEMETYCIHCGGDDHEFPYGIIHKETCLVLAAEEELKKHDHY